MGQLLYYHSRFIFLFLILITFCFNDRFWTRHYWKSAWRWWTVYRSWCFERKGERAWSRKHIVYYVHHQLFCSPNTWQVHFFACFSCQKTPQTQKKKAKINHTCIVNEELLVNIISPLLILCLLTFLLLCFLLFCVVNIFRVLLTDLKK